MLGVDALSFTRSFHLSAPIAPFSKSSSGGNAAADAEAVVASASAASWLTNSVRMSIGRVSICCGNPVGAVQLSILYITLLYLPKKKIEIMINSRCWSLRFGKFKMAVVHTLMLRQNSRWHLLMLLQNSRWRSSYALKQGGGHVYAGGGASIYSSRWCVCTFAKVQCGNNIMYYIPCTFSCNLCSTSFSNDFELTDANFRQMLRYL